MSFWHSSVEWSSILTYTIIMMYYDFVNENVYIKDLLFNYNLFAGSSEHVWRENTGQI